MRKNRSGVGYPVNPLLGIKFLSGEEDLDFALPGEPMLPWQRTYFSDLVGRGWLGQGWSLPFSSHLKRVDNAPLLIDAQGNEMSDGRCLNYLYYGPGRVHQINLDGEVISDIERDALHREVARTQGTCTRIRFDYSLQHQIERACLIRGAGTQQAEYGYDALGRRVYKDAAGTTLFVWEVNRLLGEIRDGRTWVYVDGHSSFAPLAQIESRHAAGNRKTVIRYYHTDQIGLPRELTDRDGHVQWRAHYDAWGRMRHESCFDGVHQPLRFQGQYFDAQTGLHYNQHRYYDPDAGRFVTQDPVGLNGGINLYRYALNPMRWIDPLGLQGVNLNLFDEGVSPMQFEGASNAATTAGAYSVAGHGGLDGLLLDENTGEKMNAGQLAQRIKNDPNYRKGQPVELFVCHAGRSGLAADLSKHLDADVIGAENKISFNELSNGTFAATVAEPLTSAWRVFERSGNVFP
jgi:RHS repeat-associated protein